MGPGHLVIGEGLGGLLTGTASPLTEAPGAALLYVLAGLIVWPRAGRQTGNALAGGVLGERGARRAWAALWVGSAALWLMPANRTGNAVHDAIASAPSGAGWLSSIHQSVAAAATGRGLAIAIVAAGLSAAIGLAVLSDRWPIAALALSVLIALVYFVVGQGMGGVLTGSGTDPGTGPLLILLSVSVYPFRRARQPLGFGIHPRNATRSPRRGYGRLSRAAPAGQTRVASRASVRRGKAPREQLWQPWWWTRPRCAISLPAATPELPGRSCSNAPLKRDAHATPPAGIRQWRRASLEPDDPRAARRPHQTRGAGCGTLHR